MPHLIAAYIGPCPSPPGGQWHLPSPPGHYSTNDGEQAHPYTMTTPPSGSLGTGYSPWAGQIHPMPSHDMPGYLPPGGQHTQEVPCTAPYCTYPSSQAPQWGHCHETYVHACCDNVLRHPEMATRDRHHRGLLVGLRCMWGNHAGIHGATGQPHADRSGEPHTRAAPTHHASLPRSHSTR